MKLLNAEGEMSKTTTIRLDEAMSELMSETELVQTLQKNKSLQTVYRRVVEIVYTIEENEVIVVVADLRPRCLATYATDSAQS
jgi:hypothetical protein